MSGSELWPSGSELGEIAEPLDMHEYNYER